MPTLFNGDKSDTDEELTINNDYANNYNNWRQKEELNKLKTKYGDIKTNNESTDEDSDDSSSEEEEEENVLTEQFDKDFYKTLACLKKKDPRIYDKEASFFNETNKLQELQTTKRQLNLGEKPKKEGPVFLRDYERKIIVERDGKFSDSEDEDTLQKNVNTTSKVTYVEEQQQLKDSFKRALIDEEQEDADLLKPKSKSEREKQKEDADYKEWLKGQELEINPTEQEELKPLREFWTNPELDSNEKFLRDYILNNKYLDKDYPSAELDYEQVIHDSDDNLSEDEKNIEQQEEFEHKYNFRFEEPDQEFIKRYPRTMDNSLRKKDTRRAQKRAEVKKRKDEDKLRKKEELLQLKALKRKEIEEKIEKLKEITGNDDIKFNDIDLDGDFDPNEYDRKMTEIFNDDYYAGVEEVAKPEFPDIDEELEIERTWDNYDPNADNMAGNDREPYEAPHCEDADFNMDADYDPSKAAQADVSDDTKKRKRKRRSKFAELMSKEKPKFDPHKYSSYEEYFDKYYSLDYEDMIGDLPCRFKYRKVVPNDYGLSVEEILMADDKELNKWCSLKRALEYKPEHVELNEVRTYKHKATNETLKQKVLRSLYSTAEDEGSEDTKNEMTNESAANPGTETTKKKRRRNKKKPKVTNLDSSVMETDIKPIVKTEVIVENTNEASNQNEIKAQKRKQQLKEHSAQPANKKVKVESTEETAPLVEPKLEPGIKIKKETEINKETISNGDSIHVQVASVDRATSKSSKGSKKKDKSRKKFEKNKKKDTRRKEKRESNDEIASMNPERLKTYGINPKKLKNKLKYGNKQ